MDKQAIVERVARELYGDKLQGPARELAEKIGSDFLTAAGHFDLLEAARVLYDDAIAVIHWHGSQQKVARVPGMTLSRAKAMVKILEPILRKAGVEVE